MLYLATLKACAGLTEGQERAALLRNANTRNAGLFIRSSVMVGECIPPILRACATVRLFHFVHDRKAAVSLGRVEWVAPHQPRGPRCWSNSRSATRASGLFSPHDSHAANTSDSISPSGS